MTKKTDPKTLMERVAALRREADEVEAQAILEALERSSWLVARAADLLGMKNSSLQRLLEPGRRHEAVGREVTKQREASSYTTGRPKDN